MQRAKLRAETFSDHQNAIAGRETGRILPRVGQNAPDTDNQRAKRFSETIDLITNLQAMLQDPEYAKAYNRVKGLLEEAERLTENALVEAEAALEEIVARAVKLPDGRAVFKDRDGNVRTEDGAIIDATVAAGIDWPDEAPSYEEFESRKRRIDNLREYQVDTLGRVRDRLEDENNPPSAEELEEFEREIREQRPELEAETNEPENPKLGDPIRSSEIQVPDL
ncbi:MAG: hypothetical protein AAFW68_09130 [Pseudomonadota bacterium]